MQAVIDQVHVLAHHKSMPQGLKVQFQITTDRDPAEVEDEDIHKEDEDEDDNDKDTPEDNDNDDTDHENEDIGNQNINIPAVETNEEEEEDNYPDEITRIVGTPPGQFAETKTETEEDEAVVIKQEPQPLQRLARLVALASRNPIFETMNFQTTTAGTYPTLVIAKCIKHINACCVQNYTVKQGIKKWGNKGYSSAIKEIRQLHSRTCFTPLKLRNLMP